MPGPALRQWAKAIHRLSAWLQDLDIRGARRLSVLLPQKLLPKPKGPIIWPTLHGFSLKVDPTTDVGVEHSLYYTGSYERGTLHIIAQLLQPGDHFADVGANIGLMSVYAALRVGPSGKITAFEPNPSTRHILEENIALNGLGNVELVPHALGDMAGDQLLFDDAEGNRGAASMHRQQSDQRGHLVTTTTLDLFFSKNLQEKAQNGLPHLLKMDIEGFEGKAIAGAQRLLASARRPMLIIESSERGTGQITSELFTLITKSGPYRIFAGHKNKGFISGLYEITDAAHMPKHDNVYCFSDPHLDTIPKRLFTHLP